MKSPTPATQSIRFERYYPDASVEDLWRLWTTKQGFESWWGPQGFRVEVHKLEPRVGGSLEYDMIAAAAEQIAYMKQANMPLSHATHGRFTEVVQERSLEITHLIDFIPGVRAYENRIRAEFIAERAGVRMIVTMDPHPDAHWTRASHDGLESQLTKVEAVLGR